MSNKLNLDESLVLELYEEHENARAVSEIVGCSDETIRRILKRHDVPRTHRHSKKRVKVGKCGKSGVKRCPAVVTILHVAGGYETRDIAVITGYPVSQVCNILRRKLGDEYRSKRNGVRNADIDAIERDYLAGESIYEIGKKHGIDHSTVSKLMRRRGHCRGRGQGPAMQRAAQRNSKEAATRFLAEFPEMLYGCDRKKRSEVRRRYRIVSRPHDGPTSGLTWQKVYEHNGHDLTCWICGRKCDPSATGADRPSIDHVIPLSNGGTDTYDNVRIAHLGCNVARSNRVQMTLDYLLYESR